MMKKHISKLFFILAVMLIPGFLSAQEREISVEDQYYEDLKNEKNKPENIIFAEKLQAKLLDNDIDGALALFDSIPKSLANDPDFKLLQASLYLSKGNTKTAEQIVRAVLAEYPDSIEAIEILSYIAKVTGNANQVKQLNDQLLKKDPYNVTANVIQGEDYLLTKKYAKAKDSYAKALKGDSSNEDALYGYALSTYYLDDVKTSKETLEKILEDHPQNPEANALRGKLYAENNEYKKAIESIENAIEYGGPNYDYYLDLGLYYKKRNMNTKAIEQWKKAVAMDDSYFLAYAYLAGVYDELNDVQNALENYYMVVKTNPEYYFAYEEIAILEYHNKKYKNAIYYFEKAYNYTKNYSYMMMIAASYYRLKDTINAKKVLEKLMKSLERDSLEYHVARFYHDSYSKNAENLVTQKLAKVDNSTIRGKMLFYMGQYYEINGFDEMAKEYYAKVTAMQAPMFFEYRLAEWGLAETSKK